MCMSAPKMPAIPKPPAPPPPPTKTAQKVESARMQKRTKGPRGRSYLTIPRSSVSSPKGGVGVNYS
jgi:hypothetical protein